MSWDPKFEVRLAEPPDRSDALRTARRLARACQMQRCRATTADAAFAAAAVAVCPGRVELAAETFQPFALPPPVLRDAAASAELEVVLEGPSPPLTLSVTVTLTRGEAGEPATRCVVHRGSPPITGPEFDACVELVRRAGMLVAPVAAVTGSELAAARLEVPVYADAFPVLASELLDAGGVYFRFEAAVGPAHAAALIASAPSEASITLHLPPDDEAALDALDRDGAPDLVVTWDDPTPEIWIPAAHPGGGWSDDGRVYTVTLSWESPPSLVVHTVIDHAGVSNVEAWLAERAGAPVARREPQDES